MNNKHVTSLRLSKKLEAIGVPQESEFYWHEREDIEGGYELEYGESHSARISAYLSSELGELLPNGMRLLIQSSFCLGTWSVELLEIKTLRERKHLIQSRISEAEARGKMVEYLVAQGLITF